jgi:hypothetical protein
VIKWKGYTDMPPENKKNPDRFDKLLKDALKQYRQPVPADFPKLMLSRLQQFEQQEAIKKVIRQERALLAAWILLPISAVILALVFPNLLLLPAQLSQTLYLLAKETAANMVQYWQLWLSYSVIAVVMIYAVYEGLLANN